MAGAGRRIFAPGEVLTASNVMSYLQDQVVQTYAGTAARGSAIGSAVSEGMVSYLADTNEIQAYNGTDWVNVGSAGTASYSYVTTLYYTSNGSFDKGNYPFLRGLRVKVQAAGGGGGGATTTGAGQIAVGASGGGGGYAESFISNIASLGTSITVTVGAGGAAGAAGNNSGSTGGASSFGTVVQANGGAGGQGASANAATVTLIADAAGGTGQTGDLLIKGQPSQSKGLQQPGFFFGGASGGSVLGPPKKALASGGGSNGETGELYGSGGTGGGNIQNQATNRSGGAGGAGIVIVELYS